MYVPLVITYEISTFVPQNIYNFCMCLRKIVEVFLIQPSKIGFYNRGGKRLLGGTTWLFK